MRRLAIGLVAVVLLATAGCARTDQYPSRPITLICPWSAGGGTDRVSRQVAILLERELGVPVNVVNATGGSGVTGHTRAALAPPDGYTIATITVELNMLHWRGLTDLTYRNFQPLLKLNTDPAALVVRSDSPWKTLDDLAATIRERPGTLKASGTAQGGIWHICLAGWLPVVGQDPAAVRWISINGAAPSLQELLAGGVDMVCCSLPEAESLLSGGSARCLGVMGDARDSTRPDIPTFREQGYDWSMSGWRGIAAPPGLPADRRDTLVKALERVVASQDYQEFLRTSGFKPDVEPPLTFERSLAATDARFEAILTEPRFQKMLSSGTHAYFFPYLLAAILVPTALAAFWPQRAAAAQGDPAAESQAPLSRTRYLRVVWVVVGVVAYLALVDTLGFVITASSLLAMLLLAMGVRWPVALLIPAVLVPLTFQVFGVWLRVPLPWGLLGW